MPSYISRRLVEFSMGLQIPVPKLPFFISMYRVTSLVSSLLYDSLVVFVGSFGAFAVVDHVILP